MTVAALYVDPRGAYSGIPGVEVWDETRDARLYAGPHSVVAHPPCSTWCVFAVVNEARYGHKVGSDGGCFAAALTAVRVWGGVLEHPARTFAWARFGLQRPARKGWTRSTVDRGWVCQVSQAAYGHRAEKLTWLYYCGSTPPPELDWSRPPPSATVSFLVNHGDSGLPRLSKKEANATPPAFRDALLAIARGAR